MKDRSLAQTLALLFGIAFLGAGILGFIPGITTNLGDIEFAGNDSPAELLRIFQVSILHNIVHLLFGVAGLALSRTHAGSLSFLLWGGVIYLVLFLYGLFIDKDSDGNFVPVNTADNWLHLLLGAGSAAGSSARAPARGRPTGRNDADPAGRVARRVDGRLCVAEAAAAPISTRSYSCGSWTQTARSSSTSSPTCGRRSRTAPPPCSPSSRGPPSTSTRAN